jgi:hypothetical protein
MDKYKAEAKQRWGDTAAYKQSQDRVKKLTKADWQKIGRKYNQKVKILPGNWLN